MSRNDHLSFPDAMDLGGEQLAPGPDFADLHQRLIRRRRSQRVGSLVLGLTLTAAILVGIGSAALDRRDHVQDSPSNVGASIDGDLVANDRVPQGEWLIEGDEHSEVVAADGSAYVLAHLRPYALSPDGTAVVGTSSERIDYTGRPGDENNVSLTVQNELIVFNLATGGQRVVARAERNGSIVGPIEWSPDGTQVAFREAVWDTDPTLAHPGGTPKAEAACVAKADGSSVECFKGVTSVLSLDWSPKGDALVVSRSEGDPIEVVDVLSGDVRVVVPSTGNSSIAGTLAAHGWGDLLAVAEPRWSPSGNYLAALMQTSNGGSAPIIMSPSGKVVSAGLSNADAQLLAWSPSDDTLAYTTGVQIEADPTKDDWTVQLLQPNAAKNAELVAFTGPKALITGLIWSPDGAELAVDGSEDQGHDVVTIVRVADGSVAAGVDVNSTIPASLLDWAATR